MAVETNCMALYSTQLFMPTLNCDSEYFRNKSTVKTTAYSCCFCSFPLIFKHFLLHFENLFLKKLLFSECFACMYICALCACSVQRPEEGA